MPVLVLLVVDARQGHGYCLFSPPTSIEFCVDFLSLYLMYNAMDRGIEVGFLIVLVKEWIL